MMLRILKYAAFGALLLARPSMGYCDSLDDVPAPLQTASACMLGVLQKMSGIDDPTLGVTRGAGGVIPYLQYRAAPKDGQRPTVRFSSVGVAADGVYEFVA